MLKLLQKTINRFQTCFFSCRSARRQSSAIPSVLLGSLDPSRIVPEDYVDVGNKRRFTFYGRFTAGATERLPHGPRIMIQYFMYPDISFPSGTRGFLYYHSPPEKSPVLGELRFRLAQASNVASFKSGTDLLLPSAALPWRISLLPISFTKKYVGLRDILLRDGLVTPDTMHRCAGLYVKRKLSHKSQLLESLDDTFYVDFAHHGIIFNLLLEDDIHLISLNNVFHDPRKQYTAPYRGSAYCRFELTGSPRLMVLRILKIVKPVEHTFPGFESMVSVPTKGELLCRRASRGRSVRPRL